MQANKQHLFYKKLGVVNNKGVEIKELQTAGKKYC